MMALYQLHKAIASLNKKESGKQRVVIFNKRTALWEKLFHAISESVEKAGKKLTNAGAPC